GHFGHVADVEVVGLTGTNAVPLVQYLRDLANRHRDDLRGIGGGEDLVDVGESHRQRGVGRLCRRRRRGGAPRSTGVEGVQRVDLVGRVGGRRGGALVDRGRRVAGDTILDRRPGSQEDIVLVEPHHVRPFPGQYADYLERNVLHAHFLADGRLTAKQ